MCFRKLHILKYEDDDREGEEEYPKQQEEGHNDDDRPMSFEISDKEPTPFDRFASREDRERISEALLEVDTLYREVLVLRFHEELSLQEIATVTRAPLSTVKSRLYRGLAAIKPKLDEVTARRNEAV